MKGPFRFPLVAVSVFVLLAAIVYFPVWQGYIPFPSHFFYFFPAFYDASPAPPAQPVADNGDLLSSFYMFRALMGRSIASRELPLWNPYILTGAPFLGHSQSALFYPPHVIYYILPLPLAWSIALMMRLILAGFFMALFIRALGATRNGAILSGLVFSTCGVITTWQGYSRGDTSIWLPLVCYAIVMLRNQPSRKSVAFAAVVFAMPVFAGHPETMVHIGLVGVSLALFLLAMPPLGPDHAGRARALGAVVAAGVLAIGLAGIQLLPTIEFLREMPDRFQMTWGSHSPSQILGLVSRDLLRSPNSGGVSIPEGAAYCGMVSLALLSAAPFFRNRRYFIFFLAITVVAFAIVYGVPPMAWVVAHTPLKVLKNIRMILIGSFGLAALAGLGLSALEDETIVDRRRRIGVLICLGVLLALVILLVFELRNHTPIRIEFLRKPSFSRALFILAIIPIALRLFGLLRPRVVAITLCLIAAFDMATYSHSYTAFARTAEIFPKAGVFEFLKSRKDSGRFRVMQFGGPYPVNSPMHYGLSAADGYDLVLRRQAGFIDDLGVSAPSVEVTAERALRANDRRIDLLNVKYFVVINGSEDFKLLSARPERYPKLFDNGNVSVFENTRVLPRAFAVPLRGVEVVGKFPENRDRIKSSEFDPEKHVVLPEMPTVKTSALQLSARSEPQRVDIESSDLNGYRFRVALNEPSIVVVSQMYYPGWKARVDGQEVEVVEADYALSGFPVSAGTHEVEFRFEPASFRTGAWITLLSIGMVSGLVIVRRRILS
jgi:uncharacterized membrane protein YfhO